MELAELVRGSPEECLLGTRRWLFERHRAEVRRFCSERQVGDFDAERFRWLLRMQREMERLVRAQQRSAGEDAEEAYELRRLEAALEEVAG